MELLEGMLQKDRDTFRRVCNRLLSSCFICKANEATKAEYYFILKYKGEFAKYLDVLGFRLEIDEDLGVVQLTSPSGYSRQSLKLYESILLLILRVLYDEKKRELSASGEVIVTLGDIQERFISLHIRDRLIDRTTMRSALGLFRRFNLVEILDKDISDEASRIIIYDSILMALRMEDISEAFDKLLAYRKGGGDDEETDENEAD